MYNNIRRLRKKTDENVETSKASELTTENVKNKVTEDILENSETEENTIQETSIPDAYIPVLDGVYSLINDLMGITMLKIHMI